MQVGGVTLSMATGSGVFSKAALDDGSRLLIETIPVTDWAAGTTVCDLGCGWGALGCFVAALQPSLQVSMCDINERAVALAAYNATNNDLKNTTIWCGDGLDSIADGQFQIVLCNPPVRAGNKVIEKLFNDAYRCLQKEGELWVVLRTQQGAKSWQKRLAALFGQCETVKIDKGYRILHSRK